MPNPEELILAGETVAKTAEELPLPGLIDLLGGQKPTVEALKGLLKLSPDDVALDRMLGMNEVRAELAQNPVSALTPLDWKFLESKVSFGDLHAPDGSIKPVVVHALGESGSNMNLEWPGAADRIRKTQAAQLISANLFDTVPKSVVRDLTIDRGILFSQADQLERLPAIADPQMAASARGLLGAILDGRQVTSMVSQDAGDNLMQRPFFRASPDGKVVQALGRSSARTLPFEQAVIEREILGDIDGRLENFSMTGSARAPSIHNIDLEMAFAPETTPVWDGAYSYHALSGQPLQPSTIARVSRFLRSYGTSQGEKALTNAGLTDTELTGLLGRTEWFALHQIYPLHS